MFVTKKYISRRTLLKGAGVTLALPFLDSMAPAQTPIAKTAANAASRMWPTWRTTAPAWPSTRAAAAAATPPGQ